MSALPIIFVAAVFSFFYIGNILRSRSTVLHYCADGNLIELMEELCESGALLNAMDAKGK